MCFLTVTLECTFYYIAKEMTGRTGTNEKRMIESNYLAYDIIIIEENMDLY